MKQKHLRTLILLGLILALLSCGMNGSEASANNAITITPIEEIPEVGKPPGTILAAYKIEADESILKGNDSLSIQARYYSGSIEIDDGKITGQGSMPVKWFKNLFFVLSAESNAKGDTLSYTIISDGRRAMTSIELKEPLVTVNEIVQIEKPVDIRLGQALTVFGLLEKSKPRLMEHQFDYLNTLIYLGRGGEAVLVDISFVIN
jgi:hypothetical protein